ncbi:MAG: hypothetical protein D6812_13580, partial [Deltaproteobacteria bacterium]
VTEERIELVVRELANRYGIDSEIVASALEEARTRIRNERERWQGKAVLLPQIFSALRPKSPQDEIEELTRSMAELSGRLQEIQSRMTPPLAGRGERVNPVGSPLPEEEFPDPQRARRMAKALVMEAMQEAAREAATEAKRSVTSQGTPPARGEESSLSDPSDATADPPKKTKTRKNTRKGKTKGGKKGSSAASRTTQRTAAKGNGENPTPPTPK